MTVKELIEQLQGIDPDLIVIVQKDAEGNNYSPLDGIDADNTVYEADTTWSGTVGLRRLTPELRQQGYTPEDIIDGQPCCVLQPVN